MIERIKNKLYWEGILKPKTKKGGKCIIMYHGIDSKENITFNRRFFSFKNFETQIKFFAKNYNIIPLNDFYENRNILSDKLNIAITFDDGYKNNLTYALPILEKYKAFATFFVTGLNNGNGNIAWADLVNICSKYISKNELIFNNLKYQKNEQGVFEGLINYIKSNKIAGTSFFDELKELFLSESNIDLNSNEFKEYWELLTPEEITRISKSAYIKIGSHGFYHNNLGNIDIESAIDELIKSKVYLESLTNYEIDSIGYPDGGYTNELAKAAYKKGFKYQCTVYYKNQIDKDIPYLYNRIGLYPKTTVPYINYLIQNFVK